MSTPNQPFAAASGSVTPVKAELVKYHFRLEYTDADGVEHKMGPVAVELVPPAGSGWEWCATLEDAAGLLICDDLRVSACWDKVLPPSLKSAVDAALDAVDADGGNRIAARILADEVRRLRKAVESQNDKMSGRRETN